MSCYEEENPECGNGLRDGCELLLWRYGNGSVSGFMIDSRGISITAPDVSSNYYR